MSDSRIRTGYSGNIAAAPAVLQMESAECAVACLSMVLEYHGSYIPLEKLRLMCGVSRDGCNLKNIAGAARELGFETAGYSVEPVDLLALNAPSIIHWNFDHFVVFEGIRTGKAYINDPAYGPRRVNYAEFDGSFTGAALELTAGRDFRRSGKRVSLAAFLKNRLTGAFPALTFLILSGLLLVLPAVLNPAFYRIFIDSIIIDKQLYWYKPLIAAMLIMAAAQSAVIWLKNTALLTAGIKAAIRNTGSFLYRLLRLPAEFFSQRYAGDIESRMSLNDRVADIVFDDFSGAVPDIICIAFLTLVMFFYSAPMALIALAFVLLNFAALKFVSVKISDINQRLECENGKMAGNAMKGLQIIETVKSMADERGFFGCISGYQANVTNASSELGLWSQALSSVSPFLSSVNTLLIIFLGGIFVIRGDMTIGMLIGFEMLAVMFISSVGELVDFGRLMQETGADIRRLDDVISYGEEPRYAIDEAVESPDDASGEELDGCVELKAVTFGYSRLEPALVRDFNLKISRGSRVAIVGVSGSGKTTIAKLIMGLYEPWQGEVLIGGRPVSKISKQLLAGSVAMAGQDAFLFKGSVKDNVAMWDHAMENGYITAALKDACLDDVVTSRRGGYDSPVDENGRNFSGGERQRMEIAVALAAKPSLLILDEATSALDPYLENIVSDNIRNRAITCVVISHRMSTIRDCDEIVVMSEGRIVERGTHDALKKSGGAYADMIKGY